MEVSPIYAARELALRQKAILLGRQPELSTFFVDVNIPEFGTTLPFLPIRCFRDFTIYSGPLLDAQLPPQHRIFCSSGSTNDRRATHIFSAEGLARYAGGACDGFARFLRAHGLHAGMPIVSLVPPPHVWPQSSLAAMIEMFRAGGFQVFYPDIDNHPEEFFELMQSGRLGREVIVFGTSFHHVWVATLARERGWNHLFSGDVLAVIDTGGTKGRTEAFSQEEIVAFIESVYGNPPAFSFLSEYGMCELSSQAWSLRNPHDRTFACNPTLSVFAVSLQERAALPVGEKGFLGFVDCNNTESFCCILTEDLGVALSSSSFALQGRAPDASLKGCSLNVRDDFLALSSGGHKRTIAQQPVQPAAWPKPPFDPALPERVLARLPGASWDEVAKSELRHTLSRWHEVLETITPSAQPGRILHIVASANIPITWVLPAAVARLRGFSEVRVQLPSLRADDVFAPRILSQIESLAEAVAPEVAPMKLRVLRKSEFDTEAATSDVLMVFGSDKTCDTFRQAFADDGREIIGFGDVANSLVAESETPEQLARRCTAWLGRGCLTPVALFQNSPVRPWTREFLTKLCAEMDNRMTEAMQTAQVPQGFSHGHDILEITARLEMLGLSSHELLYRGRHAWVVDLSSLTQEQIVRSGISLKLGGAGLVFVFGEKNKYGSLMGLSEFLTQPTICDPHMGKLWSEWLS